MASFWGFRDSSGILWELSIKYICVFSVISWNFGRVLTVDFCGFLGISAKLRNSISLDTQIDTENPRICIRSKLALASINTAQSGNY